MFFFFPARDEYGVKRFPIIVLLIILINCAVFFSYAFRPEVYRAVVDTYGFTPAQFSWRNIFTAMFLHGGLLHLGFNMWYLWLLGDNIEDRWGRPQFTLFYLAAGVFAALLYMAMTPEKFSHIPTIGASGAIAGVLGAYAVLFPRSKITFKYFFFFLFFRAGEFEIYAVLWLGLWFLQQAGYSLLAASGNSAGSVAFAAHFGGFIFGAVVAAGTRLFQEARYRSNIAAGENLMLNLLGPKPYVTRSMEEQGEIDGLKREIVNSVEADRLRASEACERMLDKYPEAVLPERVQFQIAESFERQGKTGPAVIAYRNFILNYPMSRQADNALFALGKHFLEMGDYERAKGAFLQIVLFYPYSDTYEEAKFHLEKKLPELLASTPAAS
jgi:membrane associated rhomboid family serine protease